MIVEDDETKHKEHGEEGEESEKETEDFTNNVKIYMWCGVLYTRVDHHKIKTSCNALKHLKYTYIDY